MQNTNVPEPARRRQRPAVLNPSAVAAAGPLLRAGEGPPLRADVEGPPLRADVEGPPLRADVEGPPLRADVEGPPLRAGVEAPLLRADVEGPLLRAGAATLTEQLAARFAGRIAQRLLLPGARLPSVRDCARRHGVAASTVVGAYDLLQAQGLVDARPHRGFFVRDVAAPAAGAAGPRRGARVQSAVQTATAPVDATALVRGMFQAQGRRPAPGMGTLPEEWLDAALLQRALRSVCTPAAAAAWLRYGDPAGDSGLREALSRRLGDIGIAAAPGQIVTTVGATHALDIVARTLLQPGDAVLVDEPGWAVEYARLTRAGMQLLPVPRGIDGPDLAVMEQLLRAHRPRLYVTVSVLHNPTGCSLSPAAAHRVLTLAETFDLTIVEDDTYAWLAPPHATRLAQLDGLRRTVYVSGFSKVLTPQWRVGYLAAAPALAERCIDSKLLTTLTTPGPLEQALAWCLQRGQLRRHAERLVQRLQAARLRTERLVRDAGLGFVTPPAGLFGWLDVGCDTERLAQVLLDDGWLIAPGALFLAARRPTTLMRINFATSQDARFWRALRLAAAAAVAIETAGQASRGPS